MKTWVGGRVVEAAEAYVSAHDHGLTVGDGVFETLKVVDGVPFALTRHLARLRASADGLGLAAPPDAEARAAVAELLSAHGAGEVGRLRITVTGGVGPAGSERGDAPPTLLVTVGPPTVWPVTADVVVVPWPRNERSAVAGLKTTSYAENVVALHEAKRQGAAEALFLDTQGRLSEGTGSNVFVAWNGSLFTPSPASGCLAGITRGLVLEWTGAQEADLDRSVLAEADEVFLTSSTRDVLAVAHVDGRAVPAAPGPLTRAAARAFAERSAADVDP